MQDHPNPAAPDREPQQLGALFAPRSVAVIGASDKAGSVGAAVLANLRQGGFHGPVWAVNPNHPAVGGMAAYATALQLPEAPDLAVICTPAAAVPQVIAELGQRGGRMAVVLTAGLEQPGADGRSLADAMMSAARASSLRILGPNCVGVRVPGIGLNASFSGIPATAGRLALVAQSGGVITAFLAWAQQRRIGLSCCVSLGNATDLDAADLLEALAGDEDTAAIFLYLESVRDGRRFIAAAARAARAKPVLALKVGRVREAAQAAATHTGALAGADDVWEAALLRAGVRRLGTVRDLFGVAELLGREAGPVASRLTILTNSGGPAVLAVDALIAGGGSLARLPDATVAALDAFLPKDWSRRNPVDIIGDAQPPRFAQALRVVAANPDAGTTLLIHAPTDMAPAAEVLRACAETGARPVYCWTGEHGATTLPGFVTPEEAAHAILDVAAAQQPQDSRDAVPFDAAARTDDLPLPPGLPALREQLRAARAAGATMLTGTLVEQLLQAFGIPLAATQLVATGSDLDAAAVQLGYPLVLKIASPDIPHKSDVGGVITGITDATGLHQAAALIRERCARLRPAARIEGFLLQKQVAPAHARELIVGITRDAIFGPVVLFGHGGTAVHVISDTAIGIPPLDAPQARALIRRTRVQALLAAYRDTPAVDAAALEQVLVGVAQLALAVPELAELDINPLLAHPGGALALDARVRLA